MKKIKLKLDSVNAMLSKEDMKKVSGGYGECCVCYSSPGAPAKERLAFPFDSCASLCAQKYNDWNWAYGTGC